MITLTPENMDGPDPMDRLLAKHGMTLDRAILELKRKIEATEVKVFSSPSFSAKKDKDGNIVTRKTKSIVYSKNLHALDIQLRALDMLLRLHRAYPDPKLDVNLAQPIKIEVIDRFEVKE